MCDMAGGTILITDEKFILQLLPLNDSIVKKVRVATLVKYVCNDVLGPCITEMGRNINLIHSIICSCHCTLLNW